MATVTPNFNWPVPTSTDLVKDGATAIEALGDSIDASLVDLKGGTTGQVLSKTSGTDMDFTWVTTDDANAIQNSIVDAKGDLISATANDTPARLAVGANGETLVADSSTSTGLRYQGNYAAGKNKVINGDLGIWQRGTSFTNVSASFQYTADRFQAGANAATTTHTITRETFTPGAAPVAGYEGKFFYRSTLTNIGSATVVVTYNKIEDVQTLAGQTATLSFWAKADSARNLNYTIEQNFGSGGSATVAVSSTNSTLSTSWTRYSVTVAIPSISGKTIGSSSYLLISFNQAVANGSVLDIWGVQLETGSVATAFQTATGTIQGELAACQRYYERINATSIFAGFGSGFCNGTTTGQIFVNYQTTKRTQPSGAVSAAADFLVTITGDNKTASGASFDHFANNGVYMAFTVTGLTAGQGCVLRSNNKTTSYIELSSEL